MPKRTDFPWPQVGSHSLCVYVHSIRSLRADDAREALSLSFNCALNPAAGQTRASVDAESGNNEQLTPDTLALPVPGLPEQRGRPGDLPGGRGDLVHHLRESELCQTVPGHRNM